MITDALDLARDLFTADTLLWASIYLLCFVVLVALFGRASDPATRRADDQEQLEAISGPAPLQADALAPGDTDAQIIRHAFVKARRRVPAGAITAVPPADGA